MPSVGAYLGIGALAAVVTLVATPIVIRAARRLGWIYHPNERTVHTRPIPDVGGIAMFAGFIVALAGSRLLDVFDPLFARNIEPRGVILAASVMFVVGLLDDVRDLSAPAKVAGTVLAGAILVEWGVTMFQVKLPFLDVVYLSSDWVPLVTVVWIFGVSTAINLIDGLDGLAAGIVAIGSASFFIYSQYLSSRGLLVEPNIGPLLSIITVGICVGFLPYNINPAKIFMGDSGALFLGLLVAVSTSVVGGREAPGAEDSAGQAYFFLAPMFIPLFILGVPIVDTVFAIIRRARRGHGLATADKGHLHHRLMEMGHGQRRSVFILWGWTALLSAFVLYPVITGTGTSYIPVMAAMIGLALYTVLHPQIRRQRAVD